MSKSQTPLLRPKPVRASTGFHMSHSQVFSGQKTNFPSLPIMQKANSEEFPAARPSIRAPSLEELAGVPFEEDCGKLQEMAKIELELKGFCSPQLAPTGFSDTARGCRETLHNTIVLRKSCPIHIVPPRPSNPMVKDKVWTSDGSSSTGEDSEIEDTIDKEDVVLESNTDGV